ncbi:MAG: hypothetical protein ACLFNQ_02280 [Spirochaetaceae bacterium]
MESFRTDSGYGQERRWQRSLPVVVRNTADTKRFADALEERLGRTVVSRFNFPVHVSRFDGESDEVAVSDISLRLMEDDPRRDPFLRAVPELFRAEWNSAEAHQIYVVLDNSDRSPNELTTEVLTAVSQIPGTDERDVHVRRPRGDFSLPLRIVPLSVVPLFIVMVKKRRIALMSVALLLLGSAVPATGFMPFLFLTRTAELFTLSFAAYARSIFTRHRGNVHNRFRSPFFVLLGSIWLSIVVTVVVSSARSVGIGPVLLLAAGSVLAAAITWMVFLRQRRPDHPLFVAVPLVRESPSLLPPIAILTLVTVVMVSVLLEVESSQDALKTPTPVLLSHDGRNDMNPVDRALSEFGSASANDYQVSVGTYLAHRYYQTALSHVPDPRALEFRVPEPGYSIERQRFEQRADGGFDTWNEQVVRFDLQWFETVLDTADGLPARLLLREPGPMVVDLRPVHTEGIVRQPGDVPIFAVIGLAVLTAIMYAISHRHARLNPGVAKVRVGVSTKTSRRAA